MTLVQNVREAIAAVHVALGAGRREMNYEFALAHELAARGHSVERHVCAPGDDGGFIAEIVADSSVPVFIYSIKPVTSAEYSLIRGYLRKADLQVGVVADFSELDVENVVSVIER